MKQEELIPEAIDHIFTNVDTDRCTGWEKSFIESTMDQWDRRRWLSDRQKEILGEIWDRQP